MAAARAPGGSELEVERRLLDRARGALRAGDPVAALGLIEAHAASFAPGRLEEERAALEVVALARAGRVAAARERALAFGRRFPNSLLGATVQGAVARTGR